MRTTTSEPNESPVLTQAVDLCREKVSPPSAEDLDRGLDNFLERVAPPRPRRQRLVRWSVATVSVGLCALLALQVVSFLRKRTSSPNVAPLAYRIEGGSVLEGGYLREAGHTGMNVVFNEGSSMALTPGTRGRIRVVDRDNAHMAIERGSASFRVEHKTNRKWSVDAGPFLVTVTGTVFTVSWDPVAEELDLRLREGSVLVSGPVSAGEIVLRAGQRLVSNLAKVETLITEDAQVPASPAPTTPSPAPASTAPGLQPAAPEAPSPPRLPSPTNKLGRDYQWSRKLTRGQWDRILEEVDRMGVESTLSQASSQDLLALANAARYRHRFDLARAALLAEQRRFPTGPRALEAIYLLGRVEESRDTSVAQAIAWYDAYLTRAPAGPLAGDALGRKMTLTEKLEGPARARPLAEDYLRRFPKGNYAGSARELLAP